MAEIKITTYEQDRLYFFVDQVSLAQKKYNRLFKTFKDAPYLSEGAQFLSDAGRELQFYKDVVEMLDKSYRKQSEERPSKGCEYCKGRAYTKKPLTVITKYGREIELVFEFCPNCGRKMKGGA